MTKKEMIERMQNLKRSYQIYLRGLKRDIQNLEGYNVESLEALYDEVYSDYTHVLELEKAYFKMRNLKSEMIDAMGDVEKMDNVLFLGHYPTLELRIKKIKETENPTQAIEGEKEEQATKKAMEVIDNDIQLLIPTVKDRKVISNQKVLYTLNNGDEVILSQKFNGEVHVDYYENNRLCDEQTFTKDNTDIMPFCDCINKMVMEKEVSKVACKTQPLKNLEEEKEVISLRMKNATHEIDWCDEEVTFHKLYVFLTSKNGYVLSGVSKKISERFNCPIIEVNSQEYFDSGVWCDRLDIDYNTPQELELLKRQVMAFFEEMKKEFL